MKKQFLDWLKPYGQILFSMGLFLIVSFTIWRWTPFRDVGGNLLASAIQLFFTFFIFERLLARQKEVAEFPRMLSAYEDVCIWFNQLTSFYQSAHRAATGRGAGTIEEICTVEFFRGIGALKLESEAPVFPVKTWEGYIVKQALDSTEKGRRIIEVYGERIPADVCRGIHVYLASPSLGIQKLLSTVREVEMKFPSGRPLEWRYYSVEPSAEMIEGLVVVHKWLLKFHATHVKDMPSLVKVPQTW